MKSAGSRRRRALIVGGALCAVAASIVWVALAVLQLMAARDDADSGLTHLEAGRDELTPEALLEGNDTRSLELAIEQFNRARDHVRSPLVTPLRVLPFVGRQVRSVDALTSAASEVVETGLATIDDGRAALDLDVESGADRVDLSRRITEIAERARGELTDVDLGPDEGLLAPIDSARGRFQQELERARSTLDDVVAGGIGITRLLEGPSTYLVLAGNNAEMRVGSGSFLSAGLLEIDAGSFRVSEMRSTFELRAPPVAVDLDPGVESLWGWLKPNEVWQNLGSTPRFDHDGEIAARMWGAVSGMDVDGVLALDPIALQSVIRVVGSVEVDGMEITPSNVLQEIYVDQYRRVNTNESFDLDRIARRDRLSRIASRVLSELDQGHWDPTELFEELRTAAQGRHLMVWSRDRQMARAWTASSVDGALGTDSLLLGLHNRGGNKLDYFLDVSAMIETAPQEAGTEVAIDLEISNGVPTGLPEYIVGPHPRTEGAAEGRYQGLVVAQLPGWAQSAALAIDGRELTRYVAAGRDGPNQVLAAYMEADRGESISARVTFFAPMGVTGLEVQPSARVPPIDWTLGTDAWRDTSPHRVTW